jgi:hypothetical protein
LELIHVDHGGHGLLVHEIHHLTLEILGYNVIVQQPNDVLFLICDFRSQNFNFLHMLVGRHFEIMDHLFHSVGHRDDMRPPFLRSRLHGLEPVGEESS